MNLGLYTSEVNCQLSQPVSKLHAPGGAFMLARFGAWLRRLAILVSFALVFRVLFLETCRVTSSSMWPTLAIGDVFLVDKQLFEWRLPERWEIVVFHGPEYRTAPYVKRIVGLPGESVEIKDGCVFINGQRMKAPHGAKYLSQGRHGVHMPCRLDADEYFVLGDNSPVSDDSRVWPQPGVKRSAIIGKPLSRIAN